MKAMAQMVVTSGLAASAVVGGTVVANAATPPEVPPSASSSVIGVQIAPGIQYTGDASARSTEIRTPIGSLNTAGSNVTVRDAQGKVVWGLPVATVPTAARRDTLKSSPAAADYRDAAALSPRQPSAPVAPVEQPTPADPQADFQSALGTAATNFGLAAGVGSMAGGVLGAVVGCPLGVVTGGALTAPTVVLTPLGAAAGCAVGIATVGGAGAIIGGAALGIPVGIASAAQMYNTLHAKGEA